MKRIDTQLTTTSMKLAEEKSLLRKKDVLRARLKDLEGFEKYMQENQGLKVGQVESIRRSVAPSPRKVWFAFDLVWFGLLYTPAFSLFRSFFNSLAEETRREISPHAVSKLKKTPPRARFCFFSWLTCRRRSG